MKEWGISLDLDGVVVPRQLPVQAKALWRYLMRGSKMYNSPRNPLPPVPRSVEDGLLGPLELFSYIAHEQRPVPQSVAMAIQEVQNADLYGNTGRSNKKPWVEMTKRVLREGGILDYFVTIFFKPEGISTKVSKATAVGNLVKLYHHVIHVDDNPADGLFIASLYPHVQVRIVQDLTTGILFSDYEQRRFPNAKRVATLNQALQSRL